MQPRKMNGSSITLAFCCEELFACFASGEVSGSGLSLDSEGIMSKPSERLRIQPRRQGYKQGRAESDGLGAAHDRRGSVAGLLEPGGNDPAERKIQRRTH